MHSSILADDPSAAAPDIRRHLRLTPEQQLAIYIDGYRLRLVQAIRSDYPALLALLGEKEFDALARDYIEKNPPKHFNLDRYPHPFHAMVKGGFAADLARVESTIAEVFMLEESESLAPDALSGLTPEAFGAYVFAPRRASRLLALNYPVNDWLLAQRAGDTHKPPTEEPSYLYIYRHQNNVQREALGPEAYALLEPLLSGLPVAEALDAALEKHPAYAEKIGSELQSWFAYWMEKGFFSRK